MPNILTSQSVYIGTSAACITDLTPPTFAGITFLDVESRGQIRAGWSAATDPTPPIRYEVYIQAATATGLFNTTNIIAITDKLQYDIFTLPNGSFLVNGTTYYVGVRAIDGVNNRDSNVVSMSVLSTGVFISADFYECKAVYSNSVLDQFNLTAWANKNEGLANTPGAVMGAASYQVYDKAGAAIVGLSGSVVSPNAQGLYVFPPVANPLPETLNHGQIKVTISVDGENRTNFVEISDKLPTYDIDGVASLDTSSDLIGSFWVSQNSNIVTTNLGTGSYQAYDAAGNALIGISETGIVPDVNGIYSITPFPLPPTIDTSQAYAVHVQLTVNGEIRNSVVVLDANPTMYTAKAVFSINALNQLEATFWGTKNEVNVDPSILGTASYQVYDKNGAAVVGLTQSGITADVNGYYHITPVSAALLTDLTHYVAKVTISIAGQNRVASKGFTLLGT